MNETALDKFMSTTELAGDLARRIAEYVADNHMGVSPDNVTWADAGSANYVMSRLEEIAEFLGLEAD